MAPNSTEPAMNRRTDPGTQGLAHLTRAEALWWLLAALAGVGLRIFFIRQWPIVTDDGRFYLDLARKLVHGHGYVRLVNGRWLPSTARLPGYPVFLALMMFLAGRHNFGATVAVQLVLDMGTCALIAALATLLFPKFRRHASLLRYGFLSPAWVAFTLAALCPFLAMYTGAILTETGSVFCTALAFVAAFRAWRAEQGAAEEPGAANVGGSDPPQSSLRDAQQRPALARPTINWIVCGVALAIAIQLRPDSGILLLVLGSALVVDAWRLRSKPRAGGRAGRLWSRPLGSLLVMGSIALAPLVAWTIRNAVVLHVFQPLVSPSALEIWEPSYSGFTRWSKTWLAGFRGVEDVTSNVPDGPIDPTLLPPRAFDNPAERAAALGLIAQYNDNGYQVTPQLNRAFDELAQRRIRAHPLRYYLLLPLARALSAWFSPRVEALPIDDHWWPPLQWFQESVPAFLFTALYLVLNAACIGLAVWAMVRWRPPYLGMIGAWLAARTAIVAAYESCEPRYTLEAYPLVLALAALAICLPLLEKRKLIER
jgi:hypothetical protein